MLGLFAVIPAACSFGKRGRKACRGRMESETEIRSYKDRTYTQLDLTVSMTYSCKQGTPIRNRIECAYSNLERVYDCALRNRGHAEPEFQSRHRLGTQT